MFGMVQFPGQTHLCVLAVDGTLQQSCPEFAGAGQLACPGAAQPTQKLSTSLTVCSNSPVLWLFESEYKLEYKHDLHRMEIAMLSNAHALLQHPSYTSKLDCVLQQSCPECAGAANRPALGLFSLPDK